MGALSGTSFKGVTVNDRCLHPPLSVHMSERVDALGSSTRMSSAHSGSHDPPCVQQPAVPGYRQFGTRPHSGASGAQASTGQDAGRPGSLLDLGTGAAQGTVAAALLGKRVVGIVGLNNVHGGGDILALAQRDVLALNEALHTSPALSRPPLEHHAYGWELASRPCQAPGEEHKHAARAIDMLADKQLCRPVTLHDPSSRHACVNFGRCLRNPVLPPLSMSDSPL